MEDQNKPEISKPDIGHSGIYYGAGSNIPLFSNEGRFGNSYAAGLRFSNMLRNESGNMDIKTDYLENDDKEEYQLSTANLKATYKNGGLSTAAIWYAGTDATSDNTSVTSGNDHQFERGIPHWRQLLADPEKARYLTRQWPRISLRASYKRKDPYRPPIDEGDEDETPDKEEDKTGGRFKQTVCLIILGFILVVAVAIPVIVVLTLTEDDGSTLYVKATMTLTVKDNYTVSLGNSSTRDFKNFGNQFCNEITQIYKNGSLNKYYGCRVTDLRDGSIVVIFLLYFTDTQLQLIHSNVKQELVRGLSSLSNGYFLGSFQIDIDTIQVISVVIESLTSPPLIQGVNIATDSSSSLLEPTSSVYQIERSTQLLAVSSYISPTPEVDSSQIQHKTSYTTFMSESMEGLKTTHKIDHTTDFQSTDVASEMLQTSIETQLENSTLSTSVQSQIRIVTQLISDDSISIHSTPAVSEISILTASSSEMLQVDSYTINSTFLSIDEYNSSLSVLDLSLSTATKTTPHLTLDRGLTTMVESAAILNSTQTDTAESFVTTASLLLLTGSILSPAVTTMSKPSSQYITEPLKPSVFISQSITSSVSATLTAGTQFHSSLETPSITEVDTRYLVTEASISIISTTVENETTLYGRNTHVFESSKYSDEMPSSLQITTFEYFNTETILSATITIGSFISQVFTSELLQSSIVDTWTVLKSPFTTTIITSPTLINESIAVTSLTTTSKTSSAFTLESISMSLSFDTELITSLDFVTESVSSLRFATDSNNPSVLASNTFTSSLITTEDQTSLFTTEVHTKLFSTEVQTSLFTTEVHTQLFSTEVQTSLFTTQVQPSLYTTEVKASLFATEVQSSLFTTEVQSSLLTIDVQSSLFTTEVHTSSDFITEPLTSYTELVTDYSATIESHISTVYTTSSTSILSSSIALNITVADISCNDVMEKLYSGPQEMICIIGNVSFEKVAIYHASGNDTLFAAELFVNGSVNMITPDPDIIPKLNGHLAVVLTFVNISCNMNGSYQYALLDNSNSLLASTAADLFVFDPPEVPTLTLNADQVIDLVFPDGNFYRGGREHSCESNVGYPPGNLEIDIMYTNETVFQNIPTYQMVITRETNSSVACRNRKGIQFAIRFTEGMNDAILRCRIPGAESLINGTLVNLALIPRNICACARNNDRIGHPKRCGAFVTCVEGKDSIMYPLGADCNEGKCRNSITGICSDNCSGAVCNEHVPTDFCVSTPSPPSLQSSTYVFCNDSSADENSGPVNITCTLDLNSTDEAVINITFRTDTSKTPSIIATIQDDSVVTYLQLDITVAFNLLNTIIITLSNATCAVSGIYGVAISLNSGETEAAEGTLTVMNQPEVPTLTLNADQVIDLVFQKGDFYRRDRVHNCESNVGFPPGNLEIDIMFTNTTTFYSIPSNGIIITKQDISTVDCQKRKKIYFAIRFTEDMDDAVLRCRVSGVDSLINGTLQKLALIPRNICACAENGDLIGHPKRCDAYVQCIEGADNIMYPLGVACNEGMCRNSISGICSDNCSVEVCNEQVPTDFCVSTPSPPSLQSSTYVFCNDSSADENSGPVNITCTLDLNSTDKAVINITFRTDTSKTPSIIAMIQDDSVVTYLQLDITVAFNLLNTIIITLSNATCAVSGIYGVAIGLNSGEIEAAEGTLTVMNPPEVPTLTLNADQVIDLVFQNDDDFYRSDGVHNCESNVGFPPGNLEIDIMFTNTTTFHSIPSNGIIITKQDISTVDCQKRKKIYFAIRFTEDMDDAVLRCRVSGVDSLINGTLQKLALIPRNICSCAGNDDRIGHPKRCDAYVVCIEDNSIMYPLGAACSEGMCRNSTSGICSNNCSGEVCTEQVPTDFCTSTTPAP